MNAVLTIKFQLIQYAEFYEKNMNRCIAAKNKTKNLTKKHENRRLNGQKIFNMGCWKVARRNF